MQTAQNILHRYPAPFRWLEQRAFRKVAAAYVCSETVTEVLRTKGFKKEVATIPFGVNTEAFKPCDRRQSNLEDGPTIGFVGRMLPGKGLDVLAKSLAKLERLKWRLLVVGDGPERENFIHTLGHAGLLDRVTFTGSMSYELVPQHFREMDILVIPTQTTARIREQFGRVIVEAMASGVPVIGSTCGAIPEVISDAGLIFPEGDATALAAQLQKALGNSDLREQLSRAGRARVEQHYTWEEVAHKTYQLFTAVLRRSNQSAGDPTLEFAAQADVF
jgi:glycosyltransferase involved in cell wall biosynthesis